MLPDGAEDVLSVQQLVGTRGHLDELGRGVETMLAQLRHQRDALR
jgi:hypothetical protein